MEDTFLEVASAKVDSDVQDVEEVGKIVECKPGNYGAFLDFLKSASVDDGPEVVEEGDADDKRPVVAQAAGRVKDERPVAARFVAN